MALNNKIDECKPPLEVTEEMKERWEKKAYEWAARIKRELRVKYGPNFRDLPPGFDPDDDHLYIMSFPKYR